MSFTRLWEEELNNRFGSTIFVPMEAGHELQGGRVKMLATTSTRRVAQLAEVPTIAESGVPGFEAAGWYGFFTTAGTPPSRYHATQRCTER